jgi:group I intron endonuclease
MTNAILTRDTFEIYRIRNIQNNKSYIGCTTIGFKNRIKQHLALSTKESPCYIHRAIAKYGVDSFEYELIDYASSLEELKKLEIDLIKINKTISPHGYNMTSGGDGGFGLIPEIRIKIGLAKKGRKHTQEHKDKISKAGKCRIVSEETKLKISRSKLGVKQTQKHIETMRAIRKGSKHNKKRAPLSDEIKERISNSIKKKWLDPVYKNAVIETSKLRKPTPETRLKISASAKKAWDNAEYKQSMIDRLVIQNKQTAQKNSDALKKKWQDPEFRTMMMTARLKAKTT